MTQEARHPRHPRHSRRPHHCRRPRRKTAPLLPARKIERWETLLISAPCIFTLSVLHRSRGSKGQSRSFCALKYVAKSFAEGWGSVGGGGFGVSRRALLSRAGPDNQAATLSDFIPSSLQPCLFV